MFDLYEQKLLNNQLLTEIEIEDLCAKATEILINEPNIPNVASPVLICGDIHGQFYDLLNIFKQNGFPKTQRYVFLGDYVDRGRHSTETICLLLVYKVLYPRNITLVRGNHESRELTKTYGFYDEVRQKYRSAEVWRCLCDVFDYFVVGVLVNGRVLGVHGGISPKAIALNEVRRLRRFELKKRSLFDDILWGDPHDAPGFKSSTRGSGFLYGQDVTNLFLEMNGLIRLVRSHQLVLEGYKINFDDQSCLTVWSAPNYCYRCGNLASVLMVGDEMEINGESFRVFSAVDENVPTTNFRKDL